jgi:hypothetical protein
VLTAGHCSPSVGAGCSHLYVVFDWAILDEMNPPPSSGNVVIPGQNVAQCLEVLIDESPTSDGELPEVPESHDWALWRVEQLPVSRIPLPVDLNESIEIGEAVAILGHPVRILLKGEQGTVTGNSAHGTADLHPYFGSSGSPVISLPTGKAVGIATSGGMTFVEAPGCLGQGQTGKISDFGGPHGVSFQKSSTLSSLVPQVGLDVGPVIDEVDYYGRPGDLGSFSTTTFQLSAPLDTTSQLPIAWYLDQEEYSYEVTEVQQGPSSGTLLAGQQETIVIGPSLGAAQQYGLAQATVPFFDTTYGTRSPVVHRVHSGVDGFYVSPGDPFDGEGPGAPHGTKEPYSAYNRWLASQSMRADASDPWVLLNGQPGVPQFFTIPEGVAPWSLTIGVNGAGMQPGVYVGSVTWTSLDSGQPPFELQREVRMDHCRQITALAPTMVTVPPGVAIDVPLQVLAGLNATVDDVDVAVALTVQNPGGEMRGVDVTVVGANSETALLDEDVFSQSTIWDDDTNPGLEPLSVFEGDQAKGTWKLRLSHSAMEALDVTIDRFEIRLHTTPSMPCV